MKYTKYGTNKSKMKKNKNIFNLTKIKNKKKKEILFI